MILMLEFALSYAIRKVEKKYKEVNTNILNKNDTNN